MKQLNLVGIDVASKELVIKIETSGQVCESVHSFSNTTPGHKKLIKFITKHGRKARVCLEATGMYHFELALALDAHKKTEVMIVNPRAIKHFRMAAMTRGKTDLVDADVILSYLKCMTFQIWERPSDISLQIQCIARRMYQLKGEINRESNRRHVGDFNHIPATIINNDIEVNKRHLEKRLILLEKKALELIRENDALNETFELLVSIKGVAKTSAIQIMSELICLPDGMKPEQWVAYTGLDPRAIESGTSVNKPRRITKSGNKYLRGALYMPAWVAVQRDPQVRAFYEKLIVAGKKPLQAIVAVMRKLVHAIWGMLKNKEKWDGKKFYFCENNA